MAAPRERGVSKGWCASRGQTCRAWVATQMQSDQAQPETRCLILRAMLSSVLPHYALQVLASMCLLLSVLSSLLSSPLFPGIPQFKESPVERDIWPRFPRHCFYPGLSHGRESWALNPACDISERGARLCGHEVRHAPRWLVFVFFSQPSLTARAASVSSGSSASPLCLPLAAAPECQ